MYVCMYTYVWVVQILEHSVKVLIYFTLGAKRPRLLSVSNCTQEIDGHNRNAGGASANTYNRTRSARIVTLRRVRGYREGFLRRFSVRTLRVRGEECQNATCAI